MEYYAGGDAGVYQRYDNPEGLDLKSTPVTCRKTHNARMAVGS
jgi:hypothetical protein